MSLLYLVDSIQYVYNDQLLPFVTFFSLATDSINMTVCLLCDGRLRYVVRFHRIYKLSYCVAIVIPHICLYKVLT